MHFALLSALSRPKRTLIQIFCWSALPVCAWAQSNETTPPLKISVETLVQWARSSHPILAQERARVAGAQADVVTARTRPNPELTWLAGRHNQGPQHGSTGSYELVQNIVQPAVRAARLATAQANVTLTQAEVHRFERDLIAQLKLKALEVVRLDAAARLAEQSLTIAEQIRERVQVRVGTGEAPRFELIRADTERLSAQRAYRAAILRIDRARTELRSLVGPRLPERFMIADSLDEPVSMPEPLDTLRQSMLAEHPNLQAARSERLRAQAQLALEQAQRQPSVAVKLAIDRSPELTDRRMGIVLTVPLFDRRQGPIAQAKVAITRSQLNLEDQTLQMDVALNSAWQQYELARAQVAGVESGLLQEAEAALKVAEAAYRYGERGILDYLDAQRTVRTVRDELNNSRFELRAALIELERLGAISE